MGYFIAGSVFLVLTMVWAFVQHKMGQNKKFEEAKNDTKKAIDAHNLGDIIDGTNRMRDAK